MISLKTYRIIGNTPFELYLLSDRLVKRLNKEFEFYAVRFYREERVSELTVCLDYPKGNLYWYLDFKKYIEEEILKKDIRYEREWNRLLATLKTEVSNNFEQFKKELNSVSAANVLQLMSKYQLRDYQAFDVLQLILKMRQTEIPAGLILSEQRTGKTRVALATTHLIMPTGACAIIVCPKSAVYSWLNEIQELGNSDGVKVGVAFDAKIISKLKDLKNLSAPLNNCINVRIVTYGLFKTMTNPQIRQMIGSSTTDVMLIGDEVHVLRNFKTLQSDSIFNFKELCIRDKRSLNIIGVTGTPAVKDSYDVFGSLSLINTSKIGFQPYIKDFNQFKEYFYNCEDTSYGKVCRTLRRKNELNFLIQSCAVQTKQKDLELFSKYHKEYKKYELRMDSEQFGIYNSVKENMEYGNEIDCVNGLVQLTRLQQICVNPSALVASYGRLAPKIEWVLKFVNKNAVKGIIMAKHLNVLQTLAEQFAQNGIQYAEINGTKSLTERSANIAMFRKGNAQVILIQQDAGRESITLPEARYTIFLERDFAQGYNEQAEARMTPIDGSECTKYVIDVVMQDTVEENIYDRLVVRKESICNVNTLLKNTVGKEEN